MASISQNPPLPGFGLPLGLEQQEQDCKPWPLFRSALDPYIGYAGSGHTRHAFGLGFYEKTYQKPDTWRMPLITLRETKMLAFLNTVTDKDNWVTKALDKSITNKWRKELREDLAFNFTPEMAEYCIEELKYKAELYKSTGCISLFHGDVVKSDNVIPSSLQDTLKAAVAPLENVPEHIKDWHPGSNGRVLDLVHPSLYPLVYGLSRIITDGVLDINSGLQRCPEGEIVPIPIIEPSPVRRYEEHRDIFVDVVVDSPRKESYSAKFQWLPCDVDISGDVPRIISYINNLHPNDRASLYSTIEEIIGKVLPMWSLTLTPFRHFTFQRRIKPPGLITYGELDDRGFVEMMGPTRKEGETDLDYRIRRSEWKEEQKPKFLDYPNVTRFEQLQLAQEPVDLKKDYGERGLQIIVKLANIHLTPEKPRYEGGSWHVEGQLNEHICASAIYYYDNENVTPSHLAFRQATDAMEVECTGYEQYDVDWLEHFYGLKEYTHGAAIQNVGSVETREGRVISFPNILQHQVQPFELKDPTIPGHRKILALFLVDPNIRIISTANVPCQQREWWAKSILGSTNRLATLPAELIDKIFGEVEDFPLSFDRAKTLREELMEERKHFELFHKGNFEDVGISLCKH